MVWERAWVARAETRGQEGGEAKLVDQERAQERGSWDKTAGSLG